MRREQPKVRACVREVIEISTAEGIPHWLALARMFESWLVTEEGDPVAGARQAMETIVALSEAGNQAGGTYFVGILAQALRSSGELDQTVAVLDEALEVVERTSERNYEAEIHRLRGEARLARGGSSNETLAETDFERALEVAGAQEALSWELRAAVSLGKLRVARGEGEDALALVRGVHVRFTEGFETADLVDAEGLIQALGGEIVRSIAPSEPASASPTAAPRVGPTPVSDASRRLFRREGEYWTISFDGTTCRLRDIRGLQFLALLLARPGEEVHSLEIARAGAEEPRAVGSKVAADAVRAGAKEGLSDAGEVLDAEAREAYRTRLNDLHSELEEAREFNDTGRTERAEAEVEFLTRELSQAVGLGGRSRRAASAAERARVNVTRGIKAAIARVHENHPSLGEHLTEAVRTGNFCCYEPAGPDLPWEL